MAKLPDPLKSLTPDAKSIYDKITAKPASSSRSTRRPEGTPF